VLWPVPFSALARAPSNKTTIFRTYKRRGAFQAPLLFLFRLPMEFFLAIKAIKEVGLITGEKLGLEQNIN
jgi:hypothetical protein